MAETLFQLLAPLQIPRTRFAGKLTADQSRQLRHVKPDLVAEIEFRAWTADGHLRHASFRGLREDKPASAIVREIETPPETSNEERRNVKLTHPDRLYWPDEGVTKEGLANYYSEVWPLIEAGRIKPVVDRVFPLSEAGAAHARIAKSQHIGKLLLKP